MMVLIQTKPATFAAAIASLTFVCGVLSDLVHRVSKAKKFEKMQCGGAGVKYERMPSVGLDSTLDDVSVTLRRY